MVGKVVFVVKAAKFICKKHTVNKRNCKQTIHFQDSKVTLTADLGC